MQQALISNQTIDGIGVEIYISKEKEADSSTVARFIYELLNFDND